jgi:hypothetical protein
MVIDMSTLARDQDDFGNKPAGVSEQDWQLFKSRRRAERQQIDVDEQKISRAEKTVWTSKEFERDRGS